MGVHSVKMSIAVTPLEMTFLPPRESFPAIQISRVQLFSHLSGPEFTQLPLTSSRFLLARSVVFTVRRDYYEGIARNFRTVDESIRISLVTATDVKEDGDGEIVDPAICNSRAWMCAAVRDLRSFVF
jgi:hypothetical protein